MSSLETPPNTAPQRARFIALCLIWSTPTQGVLTQYPEGAYPQGATQTPAVGRLRKLADMKMIRFRAKIEIIGVNPFVFLPDRVLHEVFRQAGKSKGKIPVKMKIDGHEFVQTLIKWSGSWRLYLNTPMRKAAKKEVGDMADFEIAYDPIERVFPMHPKFAKALQENEEARKVFYRLRPSLQLEINRYFSFLKNEASVDRNVIKAIQFLLGNGRFVARDKPE
jgi:uncharacterized protein DUF1905